MRKILFSVLCIVCYLSAVDWQKLDEDLSRRLQGSNNYPRVDYLFESVSLLTPAVEVGNAF